MKPKLHLIFINLFWGGEFTDLNRFGDMPADEQNPMPDEYKKPDHVHLLSSGRYGIDGVRYCTRVRKSIK